MKGHIVRRGKQSWRLKYERGTDPLTGQRQTAYVTFRGSKREAQAELVRLINSVHQGEHIDASKLTVAEYFDKWATGWAATQVGPKTRERYIELLTLHVRPYLGALPLQKLQPVNLTELYGRLLQGQADRPALAARTVGHVHRALHKALVVAVEWSLLLRNPAAVAKPPKVETDEVEILETEEAQNILRSLRGWPLYPMVVLALATGMRRGELLALRWEDVDFDAGTIRIERSLEQTNRSLRFKEPKTKHGRRTMKVPAFVIAELKAHWKRQQEQRLQLGLGRAAGEDLVFAKWDGTPRNPTSTSREWRQALTGLKLPFVTLHALRHTHASQLIAEGMDPITVSRRLGHASVTITLGVYGHLFKNSDDRAAEIVEEAFAKAVGEGEHA
jgi:integrase